MSKASSQTSPQISYPELTFPRKTTRLLGLDVARSLAMFGMVLVHFKIVFGEPVANHWVDMFITMLEGRSAGLFVILAGIGLSLLSKSMRNNRCSKTAYQTRSKLVKRSLVLLVLGYAFATVWQADILHYYGFYLMIGLVLLRASNLILWLVMAGVVFDFLLMMLLFDYSLGWDFNALNYTEFWQWPGLVRNLLFNGFHPIFPWVSLFVFGMWLGRLNLSDRNLRQRFLLVSLILLILVEGASALTIAWFEQLESPLFSPDDLLALFGTTPIPPMPQYIVSAAASSVVAIMLLLHLAEKFPQHWLIQALVATGQLALTIYLGHVLIGISIFQLLVEEGKQTGLMTMMMSGLFYLGCVLFSQSWLKRFERGPLELLMRKLAG